MALKPKTRTGYPPGQHDVLRATCIELGRAIPKKLAEQLTLVGGVVPSLRVEQVRDDPHPGSFDLDLGVELGIGDTTVLAEVEQHLEEAGFGPGVDRQGNEIRTTWRYPAAAKDPKITVDLIRAGAAPQAWLPEIRFAFKDRDRMRIEGQDFNGLTASCDLWVCGIASFVLLKGLAFHRRAAEKDAFDILWCLRHWPNVWNQLEDRMALFMGDPRAQEILGFLADDFEEGGRGAKAAAIFASGTDDEDISADATGLVDRMLRTIHFS